MKKIVWREKIRRDEELFSLPTQGEESVHIFTVPQEVILTNEVRNNSIEARDRKKGYQSYIEVLLIEYRLNNDSPT